MGQAVKVTWCTKSLGKDPCQLQLLRFFQFYLIYNNLSEPKLGKNMFSLDNPQKFSLLLQLCLYMFLVGLQLERSCTKVYLVHLLWIEPKEHVAMMNAHLAISHLVNQWSSNITLTLQHHFHITIARVQFSPTLAFVEEALETSGCRPLNQHMQSRCMKLRSSLNDHFVTLQILPQPPWRQWRKISLMK